MPVATRLTALLTFVLAIVLPRTPCDAATPRTSPTTRPNIVLVLADDLGYGDVRPFNPALSKIPTPHMDRLAAEGVCFTDAHTASSVCTPTRYNLLTGRYAWRTRLQRGVLQGDGKPLIAPDRLTVAGMLRAHGYATAAMGKWHLGLAMNEQRWADPITDGPLQHGFDHFFGIAASLDMPPFAFIVDDRFPAPPTTRKTWGRTGAASADFEAVDAMPTLMTNTLAYIGNRARDTKDRRPFFLYVALTAPHTPILPAEQWAGTSAMGAYGDFVMQTDAAVGAIAHVLRDTGLERDTLLIVTSDNGCSPAAKVAELEAKRHFPSGLLRGYKADIWEGGHRVPFIARWPGVIGAGRRTNELICLGDVMATCAELLGAKLPDDAGEDSISFLAALRHAGDADVGGAAGSRPARAPRDAIVSHSINGNFAIRQGDWKLALCAGSGGWSAPREPEAAKANLPPVQLYDLAQDVSEKSNVAAAHPDVVARLEALLQQYIADGRSTPGPAQKNDVQVHVRKRPAPGSVAD